MAASEAPCDDRHYTMGNTVATIAAQHHAIPVSRPGLLELITKMSLKPLFQDTGYLFKDGIIWIRIPLNKSQLGKKEVPSMDKPWMKQRIVSKLMIGDDTYVKDVIGLNGKIMSTTVCNLKPGSAWTLSLDDETVYPLPLYFYQYCISTL